jgi:tRNA threonylcarbamoyladenosine modification (KEOPS) complex  Pcc1 subunit
MQATLRIECKNPKIIMNSLLPDAEKNKEIKIKITAKKSHVIVDIRTQKISYLKAVINSYLSLIKMLNEMEE